MSRFPSRNPPPPLGTITINIYDQELWNLARDSAAEWSADLGLWVHYAVRSYLRKRFGEKRLARWRYERDMQDPDLKAIHEFLHEGEEAPEFMDAKYLPKSKREKLKQ